ncbi:MAG: ureidoglycolate lyase [Steroidobacteraceae bacterium]
MAELTLLEAEPLRAEAFAPFGFVIETTGHLPRSINEGTCERFDDLAPVDVLADGGRPLISIFAARPRALPCQVRTLERHPLSSQAFYPLDGRPYLIVVAYEADNSPGRIRAFHAAGSQGVSYRRNTWHHSLLAIGAISRFLVVDRGGPGENCDERPLEAPILVTTAA